MSKQHNVFNVIQQCDTFWVSQVVQVVKHLPANIEDSGDVGSILGSGRSPRERNCNPLQYSCLENFMDGGAWWAMVHGVTKSQALTEHAYT